MMEIDQVFAPLGFPAVLWDHWLKSFMHIPAKRGRFMQFLSLETVRQERQSH